MVTASTPADDGTVDGVAISRRLLLAAAVCVGIAVIAYLLMVRTALGQRFDNAALIGASQQDYTERVNDSFFIAHTIATAFFLSLAIVITLGIFRRRWRLGLSLGVVAVLAVIVTHALKVKVLTRPVLVATDNVVTSYNTYPSGHTATAIAAALVLVVACPPRFRGAVAVLAGAYAAVIAQDVQTAGWHRPSDAIGAAFVVFALVAVVAAAFARWRPISIGSQQTHAAAYPILAVAWLTSGFFSAYNAARALNVLRTTSDAVSVTPTLRNDAHQFSIALTVLIIASLLAALLGLLGAADLDAPRRRTATA